MRYINALLPLPLQQRQQGSVLMRLCRQLLPTILSPIISNHRAGE